MLATMTSTNLIVVPRMDLISVLCIVREARKDPKIKIDEEIA
jgi:hypothetical protein